MTAGYGISIRTEGADEIVTVVTVTGLHHVQYHYHSLAWNGAKTMMLEYQRKTRQA